MISSLDEALELARGAKEAMKAAKILQDAGKRACTQEGRPGRQIEGRSRGPEGSCQAGRSLRMDDGEAKTTKKGWKTYSYWMAHGERV